jgi:hypothetical protein
MESALLMHKSLQEKWLVEASFCIVETLFFYSVDFHNFLEQAREMKIPSSCSPRPPKVQLGEWVKSKPVQQVITDFVRLVQQTKENKNKEGKSHMTVHQISGGSDQRA